MSKLKRCSSPNSLKDKEKGDISVALCTCAPPNVQLSNQFIEDLGLIYLLEPIVKVVPLFPSMAINQYQQRFASL